MQIKWGAAAVALAAMALTGCGSPSVGSSTPAGNGTAASGPVKLGVLGPLTGPASTYGLSLIHI